MGCDAGTRFAAVKGEHLHQKHDCPVSKYHDAEPCAYLVRYPCLGHLEGDIRKQNRGELDDNSSQRNSSDAEILVTEREPKPLKDVGRGGVEDK